MAGRFRCKAGGGFELDWRDPTACWLGQKIVAQSAGPSEERGRPAAATGSHNRCPNTASLAEGPFVAHQNMGGSSARGSYRLTQKNVD